MRLNLNPVILGGHFGVGFAAGILVYNYCSCESWVSFLSGLILGVLSNYLYSTFQLSTASNAELVKISGGKVKVRMTVKDSKDTQKLYNNLFKHAVPNPTLASRFNQFIDFNLSPEEEPPIDN